MEINGDEFFADLLFYHLKLPCFVVIELKAVKFEPGFVGQLGMYMSAVDELPAHPDDKPTIGLLEAELAASEAPRVTGSGD